jgi:hypothetical protein
VDGSTSPKDIRILAERFHRMANSTGMPEYVQLMTKVASDLEQYAAKLESPDSAVLLQSPLERRVRELMRSFGETVTLAAAR